MSDNEVEIIERPKIFKSKQPEAIKNYNKDYYTKNKAKILENANKEKRCEVCNKTTTESNWSKHVKTQKHQLNVRINELQQN